MKTLALLHCYKNKTLHAAELPTVQWQRLVYHAADLVRMAEELRHTRREPVGFGAGADGDDEFHIQ